MKRTFGVFGLLGFLGCFLPLAFDLSLFDFRHLHSLDFWLVLGAFAVPMLIGFGDKLSTAGCVTAIACFGYLLVWRFGFDTWDLLVHAQTGGKAMGFAALGGVITSVLALSETKD